MLSLLTWEPISAKGPQQHRYKEQTGDLRQAQAAILCMMQIEPGMYHENKG